MINKNFDIAKTAIKKAGVEVLNFYGKLKNIEYKQNNSPLTQADLASNRILLSELKKTDIPILSEEGLDDLSRLDAKRVWIIDPLDGTKDFIQETGDFTIMVALVEKNEDNIYRPIITLIYQPVKKILYSAIKDGGAWQEVDDVKKGELADPSTSSGQVAKSFGVAKKEKMKISKRQEWSDIIMLTSRNHSTELEKTVALNLGIDKFKPFGSSLKVCMIANGAGDLNFNPAAHTWEWDVCASDLIVHEAGGKMTDCKGNIFDYNKKDPRNNNGYLASNGLIHNEIVEIIKNI